MLSLHTSQGVPESYLGLGLAVHIEDECSECLNLYVQSLNFRQLLTYTCDIRQPFTIHKIKGKVIQCYKIM